MKPWPLYRRVLLRRALERGAKRPMGARARLDLCALLNRVGLHVSLVEVGAWTRTQQGQAYLWAIAFQHGREDIPPPDFVVEAHHAAPHDAARAASSR